MTESNLLNPSPQGEPSAWACIADELEKLARDARDLACEPGPRLFHVDIHPHSADGPLKDTPKGRPQTMANIDAVALGLLGAPAEVYPVGGGFHYGVAGQRGPIQLKIYNSIADPSLVDPEEEIVRLRAENEQLRAQLDGHGYSREADAVPAGRIEPHFEDGRASQVDGI